ncbi:MAG: hypothetical protein ABI797_03435 [Chloroflexota bacterium]
MTGLRITAVLVVAALSGCQVSTLYPASPNPTAWPLLTDQPTVQHTDAPLPPSDEPPAPSPTPAEWLPTSPPERPTSIEWQLVPATGLGHLDYIGDFVDLGDTYFLAGSSGWDDEGNPLPANRASNDGLNWRPVSSDGLQGIYDAVPSRSGMVGLSSARMFFSDTGEAWRPIVDTDLEYWDITQIGSAGGQVAAFGSAGIWPGDGIAAWTSQDGLNWQPNREPEALHIGWGLSCCGSRGASLQTIDGALFAFVPQNEPQYWDDASQLEVWRSPDAANWTKVGDLPDSHGIGGIDQLMVNESGIVVMKVWQRAAWTSEDGVTWNRCQLPKLMAQTEFFALGATDSVFVAASGRYPPAGILHYENVTGITWTSPDGCVWTKQDQAGWSGREINVLFTVDSNLVGIGRDWSQDPNGAMWIAPFPDLP